jgi:hypothetical protein
VTNHDDAYMTRVIRMAEDKCYSPWDMVVYHQMLHPGNLQVTSQNIYGGAACGEYFEAQSIFAALDVLEPNEFTKNYQFLKYKTNR